MQIVCVRALYMCVCYFVSLTRNVTGNSRDHTDSSFENSQRRQRAKYQQQTPKSKEKRNYAQQIVQRDLLKSAFMGDVRSFLQLETKVLLIENLNFSIVRSMT